jgi:hypothetical protein
MASAEQRWVKFLVIPQDLNYFTSERLPGLTSIGF